MIKGQGGKDSRGVGLHVDKKPRMIPRRLRTKNK